MPWAFLVYKNAPKSFFGAMFLLINED